MPTITESDDKVQLLHIWLDLYSILERCIGWVRAFDSKTYRGQSGFLKLMGDCNTFVGDTNWALERTESIPTSDETRNELSLAINFAFSKIILAVPVTDHSGKYRQWENNGRARRDAIAALSDTIALASGRPTDRLEDILFRIAAEVRRPASGDGKKPAVDMPDDEPGPMAWKDPISGTIYRFGGRGKVVYDLWIVLAKRPRRYTRNDLKALVPRWTESTIGNETIDKHVDKLRKFWRDKQRDDIADKITWAGGAVGYAIPDER
jgi:hypothetical protein